MEMPIPMFNPKLHKLDVTYQFCAGCRQLCEEDDVIVSTQTGEAICHACAADEGKSKAFFAAAA